MTNLDLRKLAKVNSIYLWQIAYKLGITDATFSRKLELSEEEKEKIRQIIIELSSKEVV